MLIMQDLVNSQVSMNFLRGIATWCYFDEFHVLLRDRLTASYCVAIWKMLRKKGCVPSALTQNVKDFLASPEIEKCWTGAYCRYFREAVLPLNPELQAALTTEGISPELRACAVCGKAFLPEGRQAYCSDACKAEGNRRKSRERMRKMREKRPGGCYDLPPPKA